MRYGVLFDIASKVRDGVLSDLESSPRDSAAFEPWLKEIASRYQQWHLRFIELTLQ